MSDAAPAASSGALRIGGALVTASMLLQALQKLAERRQVEAAMKRFQLSDASVADILAARAYVWGQNIAPLVFFKVPWSGPTNERVAEAIMRYERAHPGTLYKATEGDGPSQGVIGGLVRQATAAGGAETAPQHYQRTSTVDPALSTNSTTARGLLRTQLSPSWQAHHLIPFAAMAAEPVAFQKAVATSGWTMDSQENLIALPANYQTYVGPTNATVLPIHNGSHPIYQAQVQAVLGRVAGRTPPLTGQPLRSALATVEATMRDYLLLRDPVVQPILR